MTYSVLKVPLNPNQPIIIHPFLPATVMLVQRPSDHYFCSVCWFVCLCRVFLSCLWFNFDQTWTYVICLGL